MHTFIFSSHFTATPFIAAILPVLPIILLWTLFWKGLALWHAAERGHAWWFVIMLVVNTVGLLEIIYLFVVLRLQLAELFKRKTSPRSIPTPE